MKCKGINKSETRKLGKTQYCNASLHPHQIYCHVCGHATPALKTDLAASQNFSSTWQEHKKEYTRSLGLGLFITLAFIIPLAILTYIFRGNYWITNLVVLLLTPFILVPFAQKEDIAFSGYLSNLKYYPQFLVLVLIAELYFFALKVICTGFLLDIMVDPVLHIVRLIMVLYGIACALPVPVLMVEKNLNPLKAIIISIKAGHETRWQQFFISLQILIANLAGALCLLAGLLVSVPLSYKLIRNYYLHMVEYELFVSPNPTVKTMENSPDRIPGRS
ncbi:MAG: hypothetical protein K9M99_00205 [Candidatus Cloacimonetes bacterium]|nr:hypothetical protein [Candidatus Cloacimonadota bacterium]